MRFLKFLLKLILGLFALAVLAFFIWPEKPYTPHQVNADYQKQVDSFNLPDMPPDWIWKTFKTTDGTTLRWGETGNAGAAKASVLIIPGYTATLSMYGEHVDILARRGYHVIGVDLRGQGGSERARAKFPEKLWVSDFAVYSDDVAELIKSLELNADQPIIPMAMSFGGHVATRLAGDHPGIVDGLFLVAPALEPNSGPYSFDDALKMMNRARALGKAKHYLLGNADWKPYNQDLRLAGIEHCSSNPERLPLRDVVFTRNPEQRVGGVTNQWGAEFFESSIVVRTDGYLQSITIPVQMISADQDTFVSTETNQEHCANSFADCQDRQIAGTGHCLPQESDEVLEIMFDRLDALTTRVKQ